MNAGGAPEHTVGTRLNDAATPKDGGGRYLASSAADKKKAADAIEKHIQPDARAAGKLADETSDAAIKAFGPRDAEGWDTADGLTKAKSTWHDQVTALLNRLGGETLSLRATNNVLGGTDGLIGLQQQRIPSPLDGY
ncbi:hypothetical protein [Streptomyces sp. NPDC050560]|uniref:hypothetical protein n=1 Tax=Streptomyces sp. NPDC050560 TaxID=3365630 RepID=UPI0037906510